MPSFFFLLETTVSTASVRFVFISNMSPLAFSLTHEHTLPALELETQVLLMQRKSQWSVMFKNFYLKYWELGSKSFG